MSTWQVIKNEDLLNTNLIIHTELFKYHAKNSMTALNKIRKWCKQNNLKYGNENEMVNIELHHKEDIKTDDLMEI